MQDEFFNMNEKLLLKCENYIYANNIVAVLSSNNIVARLHDERQDQRVGAYGPITGIAVYVLEKDYDCALGIIEPIVKEMNAINPFCPKCGNMDIASISLGRRYETVIVIVSILFLLLPGVYFVWTEWHGINASTNYVALGMLVLGFILIFSGKYIAKSNYECKKCGKKFIYRSMAHP